MAQCQTPFSIENPQWVLDRSLERYIPVPCGKCPPCLKRRTNGWAFRLRKESERSIKSHFVTLTYDSKFVPISKNGFMTLCRRDLTLFFKRLRKLSADKIRYYAVGEYGSKRERPHFHLILFNANELDILKAWIDPSTAQPIGNAQIDSVSDASINYCVKYIHKGKWTPKHGRDDRVPEYSVCSKGIGANYLSTRIVNYYKERLDIPYITIEDGVKIPMPRYYKDKIVPTSLSATIKNEVRIQINPSILTHIEENKQFRKQQGELIKTQLQNTPPKILDGRERREARIAYNENFKKSL